MYAGAGAADITNWSRAALIIDPTEDPHIFRFIAAKRASRIGWTDDLTGEREYIRHFAHGDNGSIYWREAMAEEIERAGKNGKRPRKTDLLALVPSEGTIEKNLLLAKAANAQPKIGNNKARQFLTELIADAVLFEWRIPRPRTNPAIHISRYEQPIA